MAIITAKLTVFFDDPFWVGVYERNENHRLEACKILFGAEPKDYEIYAYLSSHFFELKLSPSIRTKLKDEKSVNPKRLQREINRNLHKTGLGTKAQQALKLQQEETKQERKQKRKKKSEEQKQHQFELRQQKKKQKHKGK